MGERARGHGTKIRAKLSGREMFLVSLLQVVCKIRIALGYWKRRVYRVGKEEGKDVGRGGKEQFSYRGLWTKGSCWSEFITKMYHAEEWRKGK